MLTGLRFCYSPSTVIFYTTDGTICGLDIHDKIPWQECGLRMSYCCKGAINYIVIGFGTWCARLKSWQRGGKLMATS